MHYTNTEKLAPITDQIRLKESTLVCALGDSNTCNAHFTDWGKQWPELLHSELRDQLSSQSVLMLNSGISGNTCHDVLKRFRNDVARFDPDCTIVCLGSNDAKRLSDEEFRTALNRILDKLEQLGSTALLRTPTPVMEYEPEPEHLWAGDTNLQDKVAITREIAAERACAFVDVYALMWEMEKAGALNIGPLMHDAVHTNAQGHQLVARLLLPAFTMESTFVWERRASQAQADGSY